METLAKWEEDLLPLSLITPKEWGEQIKRRNEGLLDAVKRGDWDYRSHVGCPHCKELREPRTEGGATCVYCRWAVLRKSGCEGPEFDGIVMDNAIHVDYGPSEEGLDNWEPSSPEDSVRFLKAHILWAERIIDGTYVRYAEHHGIKTPTKGNDGIWRKVQ